MAKQTSQLKREILVRLIKAFYSDDFPESARLIPFDMRPKGSEVPFRCCIYKERAILRDRTIAGLGFSIEKTAESARIAGLAKEASERKTPEKEPLTILQTACQSCVPARIYVTDLCQGCVARPCESTCKFGAITIINGKSSIDPAKCKNCGMCVPACPYQAITKIIVPCEKSCPVGAIGKDESGEVKIDFSKCIFCGRCTEACPFGAVHEKSQIIDVLKHIKDDSKKVIAMAAPAIMGQFGCSPVQLKEAIQKLGFDEVYEVAQGADVTIRNEAVEFEERLEEGAEFMTTSCCAGYNEFIEKHLPEIKPFVSHTKTPLYYTAEIVKKEHPDAVTVFLSPCVAKRREVYDNPNTDYVVNYEELNAWFIAAETDFSKLKGSEFRHKASAQGRGFANTGGVAKAVQTLVPEDIPNQALVINGLDKDAIKALKKYAKTGMCDMGNLVEVMVCPGGCLGGNATVCVYKNSSKQLAQYVENSEHI
ncbi:MAG: monomeric [FeFe] hydrogenase [Heliobacteriaceae bacterium]|nr:monomeric [FeFe] hydrogenase [Heliobacteriaceae bacterium]